MSPQESLLTVREASSFLNVSPTTIYRYSESGLLLNYKGTFGLRFRQLDLEEFINLRKRKAFLDEKILRKTLTNPFPTSIDEAKGGQGAMAKAKTKRLNCGRGRYIYVRETKKGERRFYIEYYDSKGKRKQELDKSATSWEQAFVSLQKKIQEVHEKKYGIEYRKKLVGFKEFSASYLEDYASDKKSFKTDKSRMKELVRFFRDTELRKITPLNIKRFRKSRMNAGNTRSTANRYLALLKRMFNVAIEEGYSEENPVRKIKFFSEKDTLRERILTEEEEARLMETCSEHLKSILIVALNSGMRRGEILNLQWNQVDLRARILRVEKTKSERVRYIPINICLYKELLKLKARDGQSPYVFFNPKTGKPYRDIKKAFKGALRRANIRDFTFHSLRHTVGSRLIQNGVDIVTVQNLLGHQSIITTQRYTHSSSKQKREALELLYRNPKEITRKKDELLHICYTDREKQSKESLDRFPSHLFSMN